MSAVTEQPPAATASARSGSLLRAEVHRFRSRRFIQVVLLLGLLGWTVATVIALTQFGNPGADELARAEQQVEQEIANNEQYRQECLENPGELPPGMAPEDACPL